ncbi:MAG: PKD domain-containing protein [Taibaiella sp.]|nr:PKD domain-containing protein [Taibaiella sp.]
MNVAANFEGDEFCVGGNGQVTFNNTSENGTAYSWSFGDGGTSSEANPTHTYPESGSYTVLLVASNPESCNKVDTIIKTINIYPKPQADFYFTPLPSETNQPTDFINTSIGATNYHWNFGDGTSSSEVNPTKQYDVSGSYNVCLTAINEYGCRDTLCKAVQADVWPLLDLPTAFTPDGDGTNDILFPRGFSVKTMTLKIYNRWGELVFESSSMEKGWDGRYKGEEQPMDAYAFVLTATFMDGTDYHKQGNVTLIR